MMKALDVSCRSRLDVSVALDYASDCHARERRIRNSRLPPPAPARASPRALAQVARLRAARENATAPAPARGGPLGALARGARRARARAAELVWGVGGRAPARLGEPHAAADAAVDVTPEEVLRPAPAPRGFEPPRGTKEKKG